MADSVDEVDESCLEWPDLRVELDLSLVTLSVLDMFFMEDMAGTNLKVSDDGQTLPV